MTLSTPCILRFAKRIQLVSVNGRAAPSEPAHLPLSAVLWARLSFPKPYLPARCGPPGQGLGLLSGLTPPGKHSAFRAPPSPTGKPEAAFGTPKGEQHRTPIAKSGVPGDGLRPLRQGPRPKGQHSNPLRQSLGCTVADLDLPCRVPNLQGCTQTPKAGSGITKYGMEPQSQGLRPSRMRWDPLKAGFRTPWVPLRLPQGRVWGLGLHSHTWATNADLRPLHPGPDGRLQVQVRDLQSRHRALRQNFGFARTGLDPQCRSRTTNIDFRALTGFGALRKCSQYPPG